MKVLNLIIIISYVAILFFILRAGSKGSKALRIYTGSGSQGDVFEFTVRSSGTVDITNVTKELQDLDATYVASTDGYYQISGANNTGINEAFEIEDVGFFATCNNLGPTSEEGLVFSLVKSDFNPTNLLNKTFFFFSFTPLSARKLDNSGTRDSVGIQIGKLPFIANPNFTPNMPWSQGTLSATAGYGTGNQKPGLYTNNMLEMI